MRMLILKHLFDWSYDDLEREVRANLVYRMFTRIDAGDIDGAAKAFAAADVLRRTRVLPSNRYGQYRLRRWWVRMV